MSAREQLDALRRDTRPALLEELQHRAREEERQDAYRASLERERESVLQMLGRLRRERNDARFWMGYEIQAGEPPSVSERIRHAEGQLASIDRELERLA